MKIKPEILLNNNDFSHNKILITGSDESFINYVRDHIIKVFKNKKYFIDTSGNYNKGIAGDLFSDKKVLFLLKEYSSKDLESAELSNQVILITSTSSKKTNNTKSELSKSKDGLVVECYPLNRKSKEVVLRQYIDKKNIDISSDIFWYILENLDNQYVFFIQQLETLKLLQSKIDSINVIEQAIFINNKIDLSKVIFHILKKNQHLINIFNKNIYSQGDFYVLLGSIKLYLGIISSSDSKEAALMRFPRYLFGEKDVFMQIYNNLNNEKILLIYKNIFKVEGLVRKNPSLFNIIGLRFLLNIKKIITS